MTGGLSRVHELDALVRVDIGEITFLERLGLIAAADLGSRETEELVEAPLVRAGHFADIAVLPMPFAEAGGGVAGAL